MEPMQYRTGQDIPDLYTHLFELQREVNVLANKQKIVMEQVAAIHRQPQPQQKTPITTEDDRNIPTLITYVMQLMTQVKSLEASVAAIQARLPAVAPQHKLPWGLGAPEGVTTGGPTAGGPTADHPPYYYSPHRDHAQASESRIPVTPRVGPQPLFSDRSIGQPGWPA